MNITKIILVGYMASGKSAVGKKLHQLLNYDYYDLDNFIEKIYNTSIENIFKTKGRNLFQRNRAQVSRKKL